MQFNLDFIQQGRQYPPESEAIRIKEYYDNMRLFKSETEQVFASYLARISGDDYTKTAFMVSLNYFRLLSKKIADLVCGEKPDITFPDDISIQEKENIVECINIINKKLRKAVIDYSRIGECILRPYLGTDGKPKVTIISPIIWVPVVSEEDNSEIIHHCIAYPETVGKDQLLKVQIHSVGSYEERIYKISGTKKINKTIDRQSISYTTYEIGSLISTKNVMTGLDDFAIIHLANEPTSDNIHGVSDYNDIASIIAELEIRFAQVSKILDKHADPTVAADLINFSADDSQVDGITEFRSLRPTSGSGLKMGGAIAVAPGGILPQYITWDGQLEASKWYIEMLLKQLDKITEMGAVLADNEQVGGTQGYEALQVRMVNARCKARRISEDLDEPYRKIIGMLYKLKTAKTLKVPLTIVWNDGLPNDELRDTTIARSQAESRLKSLRTIRNEFFGMSERQSDLEDEQIDKESPEMFELGFGGLNAGITKD